MATLAFGTRGEVNALVVAAAKFFGPLLRVVTPRRTTAQAKIRTTSPFVHIHVGGLLLLDMPFILGEHSLIKCIRF